MLVLQRTGSRHCPGTSFQRLDILSGQSQGSGVNDPQVLAEIQRLARLHRIVFTVHARVRMNERGADRDDVKHALVTATAARRQEQGTWRVIGGVDMASDDLTVICDLEADVSW